MVRPNIFGSDVVATTSISQGTFLVGSGNPVAAEIRDRSAMQVEISTQHADYFTQNLIAIRAELRSCIVVKRPSVKSLAQVEQFMEQIRRKGAPLDADTLAHVQTIHKHILAMLGYSVV